MIAELRVPAGQVMVALEFCGTLAQTVALHGSKTPQDEVQTPLVHDSPVLHLLLQVPQFDGSSPNFSMHVGTGQTAMQTSPPLPTSEP